MTGVVDPCLSPPLSGRGPPRVLVAEDDKLMRQLVVDLLRRDGYEIEELADGEELLLRVVEAVMPRKNAATVDLIVTDVRMPFCSGLDVLWMLRRTRRTTPVLVMSAFSEEGLRERVRELDGLLLDKPFTPEALRAAVRELLAREPPG